FNDTPAMFTVVPCGLLQPCGNPWFFTTTSSAYIYTLSLHDALPISPTLSAAVICTWCTCWRFHNGSKIELANRNTSRFWTVSLRSEEHTSELQSHLNLVCRLLLEKKNNNSLV